MAEDIEHLKTSKIAPEEDRSSPRYLPTVEDPTPEPDVSEAYGGTGEAPEGEVDVEVVHERVTAMLKTIYDPEIPVNIHELGLIYGIEIDDKANVEVAMTLTAPACPVAGMLVKEVADKVGEVDGVSTSHVELTWEPPWSMDRMTEEAKLELGLL